MVGSKRLLKNANWAKDNFAVTRVRPALCHCSADTTYIRSDTRPNRAAAAHGTSICQVHHPSTLTFSSTGEHSLRPAQG